MIDFEPKHPQASREFHLGFIPARLDPEDSASAVEQLHKHYAHGGGWQEFRGFTMLPDGNLSYPGDEPVQLLFEGQLRRETIRVYESAWVAIVQQDGTFTVARLD